MGSKDLQIGSNWAILGLFWSSPEVQIHGYARLGGRGGPDSSYEKRDPGYPDLYLTPGSGPYGPSEDLELGTLYKVLGVDEHERTSDLEIRPLDLEI